MKSMLGGIITISTLMSNAYGSPVCKRAAIRAAKTYSRETSLVKSVAVLPVSKSYLESYRVALTDSRQERSEVIDVTLMKSDCTIVSLITRMIVTE